MIWTVKAKDYPGSEHAGCAEIIGYVEGANGREALQVAESAYPDAHISSVVSGRVVYNNPQPKPPFHNKSWRGTADAFADESARRLNSQPHDGVDNFISTTTGLLAGISALFGLKE